MTATAHALVGAALATSIKDPYIAVLLSASSHPIMDMIPHWDFASGWRSKNKLRFLIEASGDFLLGILLCFYFFGSKVDIQILTLCILASIAWDLMEIPYWFWNWRFAPFSWSHMIQSRLQGQAKLPWGIVTQVLTVGSVIIVLNLLN